MVASYICQPGYTVVDPATNKISDGKIECYRDLEWAPYPFPICMPASFVQDKQPTDMTLNDSKIAGQKPVENHPNSTAEEHQKTPSVTQQTLVETDQQQDAKLDPMIFITMGSLFAVGILCGFVIAFAYLKRKLNLQQNRPHDDNRDFAKAHFNQDGFYFKGNRLSATYTTISNSSFDSLRTKSEHIYESTCRRVNTSFGLTVLVEWKKQV